MVQKTWLPFGSAGLLFFYYRLPYRQQKLFTSDLSKVDAMKLNTTPSANPWWKHGFVWMLIAGPAIVVVASFITLYLAVSRPNEIITEETYRSGKQSDQTIEQRRKESGMAPAMQGRNHAATGIVPDPN